MNTENEERRALIVRLVAILNFTVYYKACDCDNGLFHLSLKAISDKNGAFNNVWIKVFSKLHDLRKQNPEEYNSKTRRVEVFIEAWRDWANKDPEGEITTEDRYWLSDATNRLGISDMIWLPLLNHRLYTDYDGFKEDTIEFSKLTDNSTEEFAALLMTLYSNIKDIHLPPGHPVWLSLGVNNSREHREQGLSQVFKEAQKAKTGELNSANKAFVATAWRHLLFQEAKEGSRNKKAPDIQYDKTKLENLINTSAAKLKDAGYIYSGSEHGDAEDKDNKIIQVRDNYDMQTEVESEFTLSDDDRLSQFCEVNGIEIDTLTDGDVNRMKELLRALDDYDFASKQGVSLSAYYGDRANSEKTQRQRLFKKLRDVRDKVK